MRTRLIMMLGAWLSLALLSIAAAQPTPASLRFADAIGPVKVGQVKTGGQIEVPYITWGGDVATFAANGGLATARGSIYDGLGLNLKLVPGDDFPTQVKRYLAGDSPYLRAELRMIGLASEVLGADPRTKPVVIMQLTWSAGDHMVSRSHLRTLSDLKGKKIALQQNGPHVGMVDDILRTAQLTWKDVTIVWSPKLTGDGSASDLFRKDPTIDACMVISPDMIGLTGGLDKAGNGAEGTVKDAKVLISTATMSRSLADVYAVRKDYYDANKDAVEKFVAGYIKGAERLVELRAKFDKDGKFEKDKEKADPYWAMLTMAQTILGKEVLPTLEVDAHGLLMDATFVGLQGNKSFFLDKGNLDGFESKQSGALDLALGQGYAKVRSGFYAPDLDWDKIAKVGGLKVIDAAPSERIKAESVNAVLGNALAENTIVQFTIGFEPNQNVFPADVYGPEFLRAVKAASTFGNAVIVIRGHADPTQTLFDLITAGMNKGFIQRTGTEGNYKYFFQGKPLDLSATNQIVDLIEKGAFAGGNPDPRQTMQAALNLSRTRADAVRDAIVAYAAANGFKLDRSQIQPVGVGVAEPLIAKPTNLDQAKQNMRVEFRLIKVPAEVIKPANFNF